MPVSGVTHEPRRVTSGVQARTLNAHSNTPKLKAPNRTRPYIAINVWKKLNRAILTNSYITPISARLAHSRYIT